MILSSPKKHHHQIAFFFFKWVCIGWWDLNFVVWSLKVTLAAAAIIIINIIVFCWNSNRFRNIVAHLFLERYECMSFSALLYLSFDLWQVNERTNKIKKRQRGRECFRKNETYKLFHENRAHYTCFWFTMIKLDVTQHVSLTEQKKKFMCAQA